MIRMISTLTITRGFDERSVKDMDELENIAWSAYGSKLGWIFHNEESLAREMLRSSLNPDYTIVARLHGKIVGYCVIQQHSTPCNWHLLKVLLRQCNFRSLFLLELQYSPRSDEIYIHMLAVHPNYRQMGIGSRLLRHIYQMAKYLNMPYVSLHVTIENYSAKRLYEREGFDDQSKDELVCCMIPVFDYSFTGSWYMRKIIHQDNQIINS